jgi:hypothetical protein
MDIWINDYIFWFTFRSNGKRISLVLIKRKPEVITLRNTNQIINLDGVQIMALTIVQNVVQQNQPNSDSQEGKKMLRNAPFNLFLDDFIRTNANHDNDGYTLFASNLDLIDKKLFLSYLVDLEDYEDFIANDTRIQEAIKDYKEEMQYLIDQRIDEVYHEDMEEMGLVLCQHRDNGEFYYQRRI